MLGVSGYESARTTAISSLAGEPSLGMLLTRLGRRVSRVDLYADFRDDGGDEMVRAGRSRRDMSWPGRGGMLRI